MLRLVALDSELYSDFVEPCVACPEITTLIFVRAEQQAQIQIKILRLEKVNIENLQGTSHGI